MFGFGKGKIDIAIQSTNYAPGDTISGNVVLTLKKPVKAREMSISLIAEELRRVRTRTTNRGRSTMREETRWTHVWDSKQQLDGEKEYTQGREYRFEIKIPADIPGVGPQTPEGKLDKVMKVVDRAEIRIMGIPVRRRFRQRFRWYLLAKLDIPGALDINKKVNITIG